MITRRHFLRVAALGLIATACAPSSPATPSKPAETKPAEATKPAAAASPAARRAGGRSGLAGGGRVACRLSGR